MKLYRRPREKGFRLGGEVRLLMIAAPGGGKGTQGEWLAAKFSVQNGMLRAADAQRLRMA
jgi:hypothetical protein